MTSKLRWSRSCFRWFKRWLYFLSRRNSITHLSYGIYQDFQVEIFYQMIDEFMKWKLPNLMKIDEVLQRRLDNVISQVLLKLGFKAYGVVDDEFVYVRYVKKIMIKAMAFLNRYYLAIYFSPKFLTQESID